MERRVIDQDEQETEGKLDCIIDTAQDEIIIIFVTNCTFEGMKDMNQVSINESPP